MTPGGEWISRIVSSWCQRQVNDRQINVPRREAVDAKEDLPIEVQWAEKQSTTVISKSGATSPMWCDRCLQWV
ncbi:hypothetical protein BsWGS_25056 [Bradybaena similaris]